MLKSKLNLEGSNILNRDQQKAIKGGGCRIAVRNSDGSWGYWSDDIYSVSEAQSAYNNQTEYSDGSYASGYCCASCPQM